MNIPTGTLIIKPVCAKLVKDKDFFSRMDPYVRVIFGNNIQQTQVARGAGKNPSWTDAFTFKRTYEDIIIFEVYDDDVVRDDMVGQGQVAVSSILSYGGIFNDWISLSYKGKHAGQLLVNIQFTPDNKMMGMKQGQTGMGMGTKYGYQQMQQPVFQQPNYPSSGYQPLIQNYPLQQPNVMTPGYTAPTTYYPQNLIQTPILQPQQQIPMYQQQQMPTMYPNQMQMQPNMQQFPGQPGFNPYYQ